MIDRADLIAAVLTGDYRETNYGSVIRSGKITLRGWYKEGDTPPTFIKFNARGRHAGDDVGIGKYYRSYYLGDSQFRKKRRMDVYHLVWLNGEPFTKRHKFYLEEHGRQSTIV